MLTLETLRDFLAQFPCLHLSEAPEIFGPTALNAQSGNGSLSVGLTGDGTLCVLRWPSPSFYDQLKYHTTARDEPRLGAAENAGAFLGLAVTEGGRTRTTWLRDWETSQRYVDEDSDAVETTHRSDAFGLTVAVTDVVARDADALVRDVSVARDADSPVSAASLVSFANPVLVVTKFPRRPVADWCRSCEHAHRAVYRPGPDAVVHETTGRDRSTGEVQSVALATGFDGPSDAHHVGGDADCGSPPIARADAYRDAADGRPSGNDEHEGRATCAMRRPLSLDGGARARVYLAAGAYPADALDSLDAVRGRDPAAVRASKRAWFDRVVGDAPMPGVDDDRIRALCRRALVTLVTNRDTESGAVVASIATQSPYSLDWPRDGAYINHVLDTLGLTEWAAERNRWYAALQETSAGNGNHDDTPAGNWSMNYYADGVVGGPIPYEIDQTGYLLWSLWDHFRHTGDEAYLDDVYPAIQRGAEFLVDHRDPVTGLHRRAYEDDHVLTSQTVVGAGPVWLGLDCAAEAAAHRGDDARAERFRERATEVADGIDAHLWREEVGAYEGGHPPPAVVAGIPYLSERLERLPLVPTAIADPSMYWPVGFRSVDDDRMRRHLQRVRDLAVPTWGEPGAGERSIGLYDTKNLVSLARGLRDDPEAMAEVREGVRWVATHHATDDTGVMGEVWVRDGAEIRTAVSQPHTWSQLLFYYAALEAFPPEGLADLGTGESVVERLRATG